MTPAEIQQLADSFAHTLWRDSWPLFVASLIGCGLTAYLGVYLGEKAKNTATKEDVAEITRKIESVRNEYVAQIEAIRGSYQLRVASLAKILETHQIAFAMWREMLFAVHTEDISRITRNCESWWTNNCIYLTASARDAFIAAVHAAHIHQDLRGLSAQRVDDNWQIIRRAGDEIMKGAELPALTAEAIQSPSATK